MSCPSRRRCPTVNPAHNLRFHPYSRCYFEFERYCLAISKMSFGFSIGDFIAVMELANRVRKEFVAAPSQFKSLSDE